MPRSEEHAFYLATTGVIVPSNYWHQRTKALFDRMLSNGASIEELYNFSHLVFFSTSFGLNPCDSLIMPYLSSVANMFYNMSESSENWDAQIEICAACLCLNKEHGNLKIYQNEEGWVLSDGYERPLVFDSRTQYSLFHTTCISLLYKIIAESSQKNYVDTLSG